MNRKFSVEFMAHCSERYSCTSSNEIKLHEVNISLSRLFKFLIITIHFQETFDLTRYNFLKLLTQTQAVLISAKVGDYLAISRLSNFEITQGNWKFGNHYTGRENYALEVCNCPHNVLGTSCEKCQENYISLRGLCVSCREYCNGFSDNCDKMTGKCKVS